MASRLLHDALCALLGAAVLAPTPAPCQVPEIYFSTARIVSNSAGYSQGAVVAQDAAQAVYLGWGESGSAPVFVRSDDQGLTFTAPRPLGNLPSRDFAYDQLVLAGAAAGVVHGAFTAFDLVYGGAEILYMRTNDGGASFTWPELISTVDRFNSYGSSITIGWAIAVAWGDSDLSTGEDAIMYRQSLDGGATFLPPQRLSAPTPGFKGCPSIALAGTDAVYAAWMESLEIVRGTDVLPIVFSRSADGGVTFSSPVTISRQPASPDSGCPKLVVDSAGNILVFWGEQSASGAQMLLARSTDGGASFASPTVVYDGGAHLWNTQAVVTAEGKVLVTWRAGEDYGSSRCRLATVQANGTLSAPVEPPYCGPMSAHTSHSLHVAWSETPPGTRRPHTYYSRGDIRRTDVPRSFYVVPPCRITDTREAEGPPLAANTKRTFAVGGRCGIPLDAIAVAANATTIQPTDFGDLRLFGAGGATPYASTINFGPGHTRANNATVPLGTEAAITVQCDMPPTSTGSTHFVLDVSGYYR